MRATWRLVTPRPSPTSTATFISAGSTTTSREWRRALRRMHPCGSSSWARAMVTRTPRAGSRTAAIGATSRHGRSPARACSRTTFTPMARSARRCRANGAPAAPRSRSIPPTLSRQSAAGHRRDSRTARTTRRKIRASRPRRRRSSRFARARTSWCSRPPRSSRTWRSSGRFTSSCSRRPIAPTPISQPSWSTSIRRVPTGLAGSTSTSPMRSSAAGTVRRAITPCCSCPARSTRFPLTRFQPPTCSRRVIAFAWTSPAATSRAST